MYKDFRAMNHPSPYKRMDCHASKWSGNGIAWQAVNRYANRHPSDPSKTFEMDHTLADHYCGVEVLINDCDIFDEMIKRYKLEN